MIDSIDALIRKLEEQKKIANKENIEVYVVANSGEGMCRGFGICHVGLDADDNIIIDICKPEELIECCEVCGSPLTIGEQINNGGLCDGCAEMHEEGPDAVGILKKE